MNQFFIFFKKKLNLIFLSLLNEKKYIFLLYDNFLFSSLIIVERRIDQHSSLCQTPQQSREQTSQLHRSKRRSRTTHAIVNSIDLMLLFIEKKKNDEAKKSEKRTDPKIKSTLVAVHFFSPVLRSTPS